jgi:hypothetical protein
MTELAQAQFPQFFFVIFLSVGVKPMLDLTLVYIFGDPRPCTLPLPSDTPVVSLTALNPNDLGALRPFTGTLVMQGGWIHCPL